MNFSSYSKYKSCGVEWLDEVPVHWQVAPIKAIATCNDEVLDESTPLGYEIEYIEISDVNADLGIVSTNVITFSEAPSRARR